MNNEERPIVFTITKVTSNFGGLYNIKTKDSRADGCAHTDVGALRLFDIMTELADDFNNKGYAVLFEVD